MVWGEGGTKERVVEVVEVVEEDSEGWEESCRYWRDWLAAL